MHHHASLPQPLNPGRIMVNAFCKHTVIHTTQWAEVCAVACVVFSPFLGHLPAFAIAELFSNPQARWLAGGELMRATLFGSWKVIYTPKILDFNLLCMSINSAFLLPFLRMKGRLFSAQSENLLVIKFSFSFSFEAFMPLKHIYMRYVLNEV